MYSSTMVTLFLSPDLLSIVLFLGFLFYPSKITRHFKIISRMTSSTRTP